MLVTTIDITPVRVPLEHPVRTASGSVDAAPLLLIDLHTNAGVTGHAYLFTYTELMLRPAAETLRALATLVQGQPCDGPALSATLESRLRLLGYTGLAGMAISGIDMAAWDAQARHQRQSLTCILGGHRNRRVPAYASLGMDTVEGVQRRADAAARQGFKAIKLRLGYPTLEEDLALVKALRLQLGREFGLMADYNQALTVPQALQRCAALDDEQLLWIEEPTLQQDDEGHAAIAAAVRTPIQLGENWFGIAEMRRSVAAQAGDCAMADLMKIGGLTGWRAAAALAAEQRLPLSSHLFQEFSAHALACSPSAHYLEVLDLAGPLLRQPPLRLVDGHVDLALTEEGAGLEWDQDKVAAYRV